MRWSNINIPFLLFLSLETLTHKIYILHTYILICMRNNPMQQSDFTLVRIRKSTHDTMKAVSVETGLKLWAVADRAMASYLQNGGRE